MTYEQRYGRHPDGLADLETPPEDWQFENPIASGKITGRKPMEMPKLNLAAVLPQNKEVDTMRFTELKMDKQIRLVAEEYNKGLGPSAIRRKLGIKGAGTYYDRLRRAKEMGLIAELQSDLEGKPKPDAKKVTKAEVPKEEAGRAAKTTVDDFANAAQARLEQAEKLAKEADLLQQAGTIALAIEELLGDKASPVISALYSEVTV